MPSTDRTAAWRAHPNADGPAAMMLAIHDQFRATSHHLVQLAAQGPAFAAIARVFMPLAQVLHHHHHAEEAMVFPFVHRQTGTAPAQLQTDHDEMTAAIDAVAASLREREHTRLAEAITRLHEILMTHLDREEELVIPVFLDVRPHELWALLQG
jgi:DUF438 domain-containing protein